MTDEYQSNKTFFCLQQVRHFYVVPLETVLSARCLKRFLKEKLFWSSFVFGRRALTGSFCVLAADITAR